MRRVVLGTTGIEASRLGFGCASLGSRIAADEGLRALEIAFERGVTWLDLAPAYGRGEAENIARGFLRGRRDQVQIATKVGLAPPRRGRWLAPALMPIARHAIGAIPGLRAAVQRSGVQTNRKLPLTPDILWRSLEMSLRRLDTDHVDLYALHNAEPAELAREELLRALEGILVSGKARAIGVASDEAAARAALAAAPTLSVIQLPLPVSGASSSALDEAAAAGFGMIAHSVFGAGACDARALARIKSDPGLRAEVTEAVGTFDLPAAVARLRLARAFTLVSEGVILVSMFSERSRRENLLMAEREGRGSSAVNLAERLFHTASPGVNTALENHEPPYRRKRLIRASG